jgi:fatty acid desaturase
MKSLDINLASLKPDNRYGFFHTIKILVLFILSLLSFSFFIEMKLFYLLFFSFLFLGVQAYKMTIVLHDCGHGFLFTKKSTNRFVGRWMGAVLGSRYENYTFTHWQHHLNYGTDQDPQGADYLGLAEAGPARFGFHILKPLLGLNLIKLGKFPQNKGQTKKERDSFFWPRLFVAQAIIALLATQFGKYPYLFFAYPLSAATFGLFFSQVRGFCEHIAPPGGASEQFVRTHDHFWFDKIFFYDLNFNFHVEHHEYPSIPSIHLEKIHKEIKHKYSTNHGFSKTIFSTITHRVFRLPEKRKT